VEYSQVKDGCVRPPAVATQAGRPADAVKSERVLSDKTRST
jgi:hypothetical protein